ncbi:Stage II sporulation protein E (SpoIIE) [Bernardetia litoralis DSM 6794]|uniref:Stage II sporulation protein E (SpoIIE) n=1 Tax=Bernardetia litoralis (strain ATCC 23117 / DSM 6794 / NBRC 15988 / NCIMB 1366 / Fx l1 / Sio-4) TaxID=880071 RepID=I4AG96_BERLS|nr:SpoIIE family protein phosphatase [Bernardetia litoralis]AFM02981.1 Stage II sporulation protein E (SpoIIE) [Bernardetia litoralis DSM 6794]
MLVNNTTRHYFFIFSFLFLAFSSYFFSVSFSYAQLKSDSILKNNLNLENKKRQKTSEVESLIRQLEKIQPTQKVGLLIQISEFYRTQIRDSDKALEYATQAIKEATKLRDKKAISQASIQAGALHRNKGESDFALTLFIRGLNSAEEIGNDSLQTDALHKIAVTYLLMRDFEQSYQYAIKEEKMWRASNSEYGLASSLNLKGISLIYLKRLDEAIKSLEQSLTITKKLDNEELLYKVFSNLADAYLKKGELGKATLYITKSKEITERINDNYGNIVNMIKLGEIYSEKGDLSKAINTTEEGLKLAQNSRYAALARNGYEALRDIYFKVDDYQKAFENQSLAVAMNDSLSNISRRHQVSNMQTYYESERNDRENQLLKEENKNKNLTLYLTSTIALIGFLLVGLFIYRTQVKKKTITKLRNQNDEIRSVYEQISKQATVIDDTNTTLTESLNYARRIQDAMQVNTTTIFEELSDNFIIDRPRDIVSGDCYWFEQHQGDFYVALADCTGHGIPGALMTILCNSLLNDIFNSRSGVRSPAEMLIELHHRLIHHLHQQKSNVQDGMDIAICRINKNDKTITYAGAKQPLLYVDKDGEFNRFKASSLPIGGHEVKIKRKLEDITIHYQVGDTLYITSDGYQDQFGGKNDKKFMSKRLYNMLVEIHKMPLEKQKIHIETQLNNWQANNEQTDDIMMIGIKLN